MKRIFVFLISAAAALSFMAACTDLSGVEGRLDDLEERMAAMTNSVMALNENVKALQAFSQSGQTVKEISQDGNTWRITLGDGSVHTIVVENGPVLLNVAIDEEGYWTLDGQRILSDGKPVKATGEKGDKGETGDKGDNGSDGNDGADGADGRTPIFGVDSEGYWTVRYDENEEPERITDVNGGYVLAAGSGSGSGDSFFKSVSIVDGELVIVLNSNPEKVYRLPIEGGFSISVSADQVAIMPGATVEVPFEVNGADATTRIFVEAYGYTAVLREGAVAITAPDELPADGYVIIKAIRNSDSSYKAVCISFENGVFSYVVDAQSVGKDGGNVEIAVTTNLDYEVVIPGEASWLHIAPQVKAVRTETVVLVADENEGAQRSASVRIVPSMGEVQEVRIVQYGADDIVFEDVDLSSVVKFVVSGSAAQEPAAMTQVLENEDVFAFYGDLKAGEMYIGMLGAEDVSLGAIVPEDGTDINAADAQPFDQDFTGMTVTRHWSIPADGKYRIVLNRASGEVTIYDEANDLQPVKAEYYYAGNEKSWFLSKTLTPGTYYISTMTGWDSWKGKAFDFAVSLADPQILYSTSTLAITDGFCIKVAQSVNEVEILAAGTEVDPAASGTMDFVSKTFAFCPATEPGVVTAVDIAITTDEWIPMAQAVSNRKWKPAERIEIKTIIIDARNNKIFFKL